MRKIIRCIEALSANTAALQREVAGLRAEMAQMRAAAQPAEVEKKAPSIVQRVIGWRPCRNARTH